MKVIKLQEPYNKAQIDMGPIILALGFFDGVHRGHQEVIKKALQKGKELNAKVAVMTFDRHPKIIFNNLNKDNFKYLTTLTEKIKHFEKLGVDITYVVKFDEKLAYLPPQEFIDKYVVDLNAVCVVAGQDYTYGKHDIANMETLPKFAKSRFEIINVHHLQQKQQKISSTKIRKDIDIGNIEDANFLLGYEYTTHGIVVHGFQRGRKIGFPTLNIESKINERVLGDGVYAVEVEFEKNLGTWYLGMASIGNNETFGNDLDKTIEINLFDFSKEVYGAKVTIKWHKYLRNMIKFNTVPELIEQLKKDKIEALKILKDD